MVRWIPPLRWGTWLPLGMLCVALLTFSTGCRHGMAADSRPETWGIPMTLPGVPNFHRIDEGVYRSAQPTPEGFRQLEAHGFHSIICLRNNFTDRNAQLQTRLQVHYIQLPPLGGNIPEEALAQALAIMTCQAEQPCLVHCLHGADRTGIVCAAYRLVVQGWSKEEALEEMKAGGYGHHRWWPVFAKTVRRLDVDALKRRLNDLRN